LLALCLAQVPAARAQSSAASARTPRPKFEVASVKPCIASDAAASGKRGPAGESLSPATFRLDCTTVIGLITHAYVLFANGHVNPTAATAIEGGPPWIHSALYRIDAKTASPQSEGLQHGPMLQALLEDRFQVKIRRATRKAPAYALVVAKGGPKLRRFQEGACTPLDLRIFEQFPPQPFPELPPGQKYCGGVNADGTRWVGALTAGKGPNVTIDARAMTIDDFLRFSLHDRLDRPVLNRTGLAGRFDFHLEYSPAESAPGPGNPAPPGAVPGDFAGPSIFTALQRQLGLQLKPARGVEEVLVINRVERPSAN
jgi:uncharacterized protein (TIGR03435 family)